MVFKQRRLRCSLRYLDSKDIIYFCTNGLLPTGGIVRRWLGQSMAEVSALSDAILSRSHFRALNVMNIDWDGCQTKNNSTGDQSANMSVKRPKPVLTVLFLKSPRHASQNDGEFLGKKSLSDIVYVTLLHNLALAWRCIDYPESWRPKKTEVNILRRISYCYRVMQSFISFYTGSQHIEWKLNPLF